MLLKENKQCLLLMLEGSCIEKVSKHNVYQCIHNVYIQD